MTSANGFDGVDGEATVVALSCHCSDGDDDDGGAMTSAFWVCADRVRVGRLQPKKLRD